MEVIQTAIAGLLMIQPRVFEDERGYFFETFSLKAFEEKVGNTVFVQDNESRSRYGTSFSKASLCSGEAGAGG